MISIRPETPADRAAIRTVNLLAFGRENEARLVERLRASTAFIAELSLVAEENREVIGHILFSSIRIRTPAEAVAALALAPMAVHPGQQRHGIGSTLVRRGLDECRRLGHRIVVVVGHPKYYPRFGFVSARSRGLEAPFPVPDAAFMVLEITPHSLTGGYGVVEYPGPFGEV
jgi:putative acetyltransferase